MEVLTSLDELDRKLDAASVALETSDDEMRKVFQSFRMDYPAGAPADPWSTEYRTWQNELYERVAQRAYSTDNEHTAFDVESSSSKPFPFYTASCSTVSSHLSLIATLIRLLDLPTEADVLEFGPGWGNTTLFLAQMGYNVRAYDIEKNFVDLIKRRAERLDLTVDARVGGFLDIESIEEKFDVIVFFECFHHCSDHLRLIDNLAARLKPGGKVVFGAEPILPDFPVPWGLRLDGESLWAVRKFGWLELGFQVDYFLATMARYGWDCSVHKSLDASYVNFYVATRAPVEPLQFDASSDLRLMSGVAERSEAGLRVPESSGYLTYGPYCELAAGRYLAEVDVEIAGSGWLQLEIGAGASLLNYSERVEINQADTSAPAAFTLSIDFTVERLTEGVETRVIGTIDSGAITVKHVRITPVSEEDGPAHACA